MSIPGEKESAGPFFWFLGSIDERSIRFVPMMLPEAVQGHDARPGELIALVRDSGVDRALLVTHHSSDKETVERVSIISDHINLTGWNPLIGTQREFPDLGFPDMSRIYSPTLQQKLHTVIQSSPTVSENGGLLVGVGDRESITQAERTALRDTGPCFFTREGIHEGVVLGAAGIPIAGLAYSAPDEAHRSAGTMETVLSLVSAAVREIL